MQGKNFELKMDHNVNEYKMQCVLITPTVYTLSGMVPVLEEMDLFHIFLIFGSNFTLPPNYRSSLITLVYHHQVLKESR